MWKVIVLPSALTVGALAASSGAGADVSPGGQPINGESVASTIMYVGAAYATPGSMLSTSPFAITVSVPPRLASTGAVTQGGYLAGSWLIFALLVVLDRLAPQAVSPNGTTARSPHAHSQSGLDIRCIFGPFRSAGSTAASRGQGRDELSAGTDAALPVDLDEVRLDAAGAHVQRAHDFLAAHPARQKFGDPRLCRRETGARCGRPPDRLEPNRRRADRRHQFHGQTGRTARDPVEYLLNLRPLGFAPKHSCDPSSGSWWRRTGRSNVSDQSCRKQANAVAP